MFDAIIEHINKVKSLTVDKTFEFVFSKKDMQDFIIELNTEKQLFEKRIDSSSKKLPKYSKATEILSNGEKKAGQSFTLKDTGEFYDSFRIILGVGKLDIIANTIKEDEDGITDLLIYSQDIIGLTNESLELLQEKSKAKTIEYIKGMLLR